MPNNHHVTEEAHNGPVRTYVSVRLPRRTGPYTGTCNVWRSGPEHNTLVSSDRVDARRHTTGERRGEWEISVNGGFATYHRTLRAGLRCLAGAKADAAAEKG